MVGGLENSTIYKDRYLGKNSFPDKTTAFNMLRAETGLKQ
jgi:hypothetical protein